MTETEKRLPARVQQIIDRCFSGERLCRSYRMKETGECEEVFVYEPSGKRAPTKSSHEAIATGKLSPLGDSLFEAELSQSWAAKS